MNDYLYCYIDKCKYILKVPYNTSEKETDRLIAEYKAHIKSHGIDAVVNHCFDLIMAIREQVGGNFNLEPPKILVPEESKEAKQ